MSHINFIPLAATQAELLNILNNGELSPQALAASRVVNSIFDDAFEEEYGNLKHIFLGADAFTADCEQLKELCQNYKPVIRHMVKHTLAFYNTCMIIVDFTVADGETLNVTLTYLDNIKE